MSSRARIATLIALTGYAICGYASGQLLLAGVVSTLLALAVLWAVVRPLTAEKALDEPSLGSKLMLYGFVLFGWVLGIDMLRDGFGRPEAFAAVLGLVMLATVAYLTQVIVRYEFTIRRERRTAGSAPARANGGPAHVTPSIATRGCDYCRDDQNMSFGHVEQVATSERGVLLRCPQCHWLYVDSAEGLFDPVRVDAGTAEHWFGYRA